MRVKENRVVIVMILGQECLVWLSLAEVSRLFAKKRRTPVRVIPKPAIFRKKGESVSDDRKSPPTCPSLAFRGEDGTLHVDGLASGGAAPGCRETRLRQELHLKSQQLEGDGASAGSVSRRMAITHGAAAAALLASGGAMAQTDGELTRVLRELAPHDRAPAARRRQAAPRRLVLRGQRTVIVDMSRRVDVTVFFDLNSSSLRPDARITLLRLARALNDPILADQNFLIAGHTSADGDYDFNVALSHDRSNSVRDWLIAYGDVSGGRLTANGFGPDLPRTPSNPASPINRRVEIIAVTS
jgi:outer membrane protein OmpA-like peptidoglycan-associated protein